MTTDITELAQSLKAAADSVIKNYDCEWFETGSQICTVHKSKVNLISLANPANILALVEALEKAQGMEAYWKTQCRGITDHCEELQARIAELESVRDEIPFGIDTNSELELAAFKMSLAAMDSEPVAWLVGEAVLFNPDTVEAYAKRSELPVKPLYTHPPINQQEPVAWDYEWASCITCEGPQDFKRVIEREAPPEWAVDEGQARNIIPLYRHAQPAPVVPEDARQALRKMVDEIIAELDAEESACRAAMLQAEPVTTPNKLGNSPAQSPIDHGYRKGCECSGCKTIVRICAELAGWIPVSERMPDDSGDVLCTAEFDGPGDWRKKVGYWHEGKWVVYGASWTPTHWMPLPAAPQEVKP
ncbi:DUF551 domain-containing protein [Klebsiella aerogenes]